MFKVNRLIDGELSAGFRQMFGSRRITFGIFFPIESFQGDTPSMKDQGSLAALSEQLGFAALWFRDVPLRDPYFGDTGQVFDPWVYLGYIASITKRIALATGAIIAPLRHPLHIAKAAASVDRLSGGRLVLGLGSGDRASEYSAFGKDLDDRSDSFRESIDVIRRVLENEYPQFDSSFGCFSGVDLIPKPITRSIPILIAGHSGQSIEWIAENACGWVTYPRTLALQAETVRRWRNAVDNARPGAIKPLSQSLYIDLADDPDARMTPIHLGYRLGRTALRSLLEQLETIGMAHVAFNFKYGKRPAKEVLQEIGEMVLPHFQAGNEAVSVDAAIPITNEAAQIEGVAHSK